MVHELHKKPCLVLRGLWSRNWHNTRASALVNTYVFEKLKFTTCPADWTYGRSSVIDGGEYVAEPEDADDSDLGKELQEVAGVDEDKGEIDDLARSGGPANAAPAAAPALLISHRRHLQRSHGLRGRRAQRAGLTQQRQKVKYAEAMMAEAKRQQLLREAAFIQHERHLHHAMMMHKQAKHHLN